MLLGFVPCMRFGLSCAGSRVLNGGGVWKHHNLNLRPCWGKDTSFAPGCNCIQTRRLMRARNLLNWALGPWGLGGLGAEKYGFKNHLFARLFAFPIYMRMLARKACCCSSGRAQAISKWVDNQAAEDEPRLPGMTT